MRMFTKFSVEITVRCNSLSLYTNTRAFKYEPKEYTSPCAYCLFVVFCFSRVREPNGISYELISVINCGDFERH